MKKKYDIVLVGTGIMSSTLAVLLNELHPTLKILMVEKLPESALESSGSFNNAGTGHSGFCELNYTKMKNGIVDISKAVSVNKSFEQSKQFWNHLVSLGHITPDFIHSVPHMSFVEGSENCYELEKRYETMKKHYLFSDMEFTRDYDVIKEWSPLIVEGRPRISPIATTRVKRGVDVDFGNLTSQLINYVSKFVDIKYNTLVTDITKKGEVWEVILNDSMIIECDKIFVGAGGATLPLLQKSKIKEIDGYGGFPVSGQWLICDNEEVIKQHNSKVYGKASVGAPPMSVPHLDTRIIDGKKHLIFGPYAGFSTKFLKTGDSMDLLKSINFKNLGVMVKSGLNNFGLTKYLISEVLKSENNKFNTLLEYFPNAKREDWTLLNAGQRVQVIKKEKGKSVIEFGTEVVSSQDGSIVGLLGASPGASTAVHIMLDVIEKMNITLHDSDKTILDIVGLEVNEQNFDEIERMTSTTLNLKN